MTRLNKKCLIASSGFHALLVCLLIFGSAFFVAKEKPITHPRLQFVPSKFIEAALAGGGGNPNIARTDDVQKGSPDAPVPIKPPAAKQTPVRQPDPPPEPPKPTPKPVEKVEVPKPEVAKAPKQTTTPKPPTDVAKVPDATAPKRKIDLTELKPIAKDDSAKIKAKAEEEARAESQRIAAANRKKVASQLNAQLNNAATDLQRGFAGGTRVDVGGPGGEAFASYGALVQAAYDAAWQVIQDLSDDDAITRVTVTIARDGRVLSSVIIRRSGNATMDRSVQRALDRVRDQRLPPFPDFIKDLERKFTIEFNLKTRKLLG
jgi:TonB family protein